MSIKINDINNNHAQRSGEGGRVQEQAARGPSARNEAAKAPTAGDRVTLTQTAQQMQELEAAVRREPTVNSERVAALKAAIARGEYQVDARSIAEKLMRVEDEL